MTFSTLRYALSPEGIATVTFDEPGSPVNTMKPEWQADMLALADQLQADQAALKGVLLTSAKTTFFAGADLKGVLKLQASDAAAGFVGIEAVKKAFRRIETMGKPVVALLQGAALGGGWEVALIAHARFALDQPKILFGLPEVTLGLIPGATGITKMTRLLGLMAAQPYLMEGKLFNPSEALSLGLVDGLASSPEQLMDLALVYIHDNPQLQQPWDRKGYKMPGGSVNSPAVANGLAVAPAMLFNKAQGLYPAAQAILESMVEGAQVDYDTATRIESRKLAKVMVSQTTKNMITAFFFNLNAIKAGQSRPRGFAPWKPTKVGILGAGMMGAGIALVNAKKSIPCVLLDVDLKKAQQAQALPLIHATDKVSDLHDCDLVIEAVFENRSLKAQVTQEAEAVMNAAGVFATNTSTLPISGLAQASVRPTKFVGLHFFSPVDKMRLVEIIKGAQTDDETLARAYDYVLALGKTPIVVNDGRGFFTSRVFGTYVMEGAAMLGEGIPAALIEHAALAAGMPVGPLAVMDETSLSLSVHVMEQTRADFAAEGKTHVSTAGEMMVERMVHEFKRSGRAAGAGFYDYPSSGPKRLWSGLKQHFEKPLTDNPQALQRRIKQRLLYRQAVETARCLQENVLTSAHDANIGSIFGIGFPAWTGGALQFVFSEGLDNFVNNCRQLDKQHGKGFALSPEVIDCLQKHAT
ncbi:MAG: 3-hydroxyacyl-CoA dehydrogenase [Betaproteobacteria bacterium]|nr:3-hydroxyacyl-CoA dehydrogenase [Betaproteobacteria bacterium]